ncbi:MAG: tetratricopeptide repeat protein [Ferruginibacter sp.]
MKKIIAVFCFIAGMKTVFAQKLNVDSSIRVIAVEKDDDKKVELLAGLHTNEFNNSPNLVIEIGLKLLKQSQVDKSIIEASAAYSMLGHGYRLMGNNIKGLEYHHKAISLAEKTGNFSLLAMAENQLAHIYKDRGENEKAIKIYLSSSNHAEKGKNEVVKIWPLSNLGTVYLLNNNVDSALIISQRAYEYIIRTKNNRLLFLTFLNLAAIQSKMGNAPLAITYFDMAKKEAAGKSYTRYLNLLYTFMAEHYKSTGQTDSCALYAKKAIVAVSNTPFFYLSNKPAQLLTDIYEKTNCDSTLKYAKVLKTANDSLNSSKANQQILLMTFEEDLRQQELAAEKIKENKERQQNIQYALIAFGIITFIIIFLLLSRSFITNTKMIGFLGVIALLIVFEFLNLLLHPFLERITNHSPVLMLLALVCIAALLVPLHHRVEKWATAKLVEKNKQIRLAAAKKTIEQLENNKAI